LYSVLFWQSGPDLSHEALWERMAFAAVASQASYQKPKDGVELLMGLGADDKVQTFSVDNVQVMVARLKVARENKGVESDGDDEVEEDARVRGIVAVQGTHDSTTAAIDLDVSLRKCSLVGGANIHSGFAEVAEHAAPLLEAAYRELGIGLEDSVTFTGHSLGGALALIFAMMRVQSGGAVEQVTTLGQPRVMDDEAAKAWKERLQNTLVRVRNGKDPVPCAPFVSEGYAHIGKEVVLGSSELSLLPEGDHDEFALNEVLSVEDHRLAHYISSLLALSKTESPLVSLLQNASQPSEHSHALASHALDHVEKMLDSRCFESWEVVDPDQED